MALHLIAPRRSSCTGTLGATNRELIVFLSNGVTTPRRRGTASPPITRHPPLGVGGGTPSLHPVRYSLPSTGRSAAPVQAAPWRTLLTWRFFIASRQAVHAPGARPRWTRAVFLLLRGRDRLLVGSGRELAPTCGEPRTREHVPCVSPRVAPFRIAQARDLARFLPVTIFAHGAALVDKTRTLCVLFVSHSSSAPASLHHCRLLCILFSIPPSPSHSTSHQTHVCPPVLSSSMMPRGGFKRATPAGRGGGPPKAPRLAPPMQPTAADRRNKDELRAAVAGAGSVSLPPLRSYAGQGPMASAITGAAALGAPPLPPPFSAPQPLLPARPPVGAAVPFLPVSGSAPAGSLALAAVPAGPQDALPVAPPTSAATSLQPPVAPALPPLGSQVDLSTDFLTQPDFYLRGVASRMASYNAQVALPRVGNDGAGHPPQGPPAGGVLAARDAMSQPPAFPRPASPPPVRGTPSTSLSPPGMGTVEYEENRQAVAARARVASSSAPSSAVPPSPPAGPTDAGSTQYLNVDDTQIGAAVHPPPAPGAPALQSVPSAGVPEPSQRRATVPRTPRAPRSRKNLAPPPSEGTWEATLSRGARSSAGNSAARRGPTPSGAGGSNGTPPVRSPAASATQTRRGPPTPGSTMTLNAASGAPTFAVDEDSVAKSACVRGLTASVGTLTKRMGTLEGNVSDTGRRLQTQGASIEALARSVSALRSTVQQGFAQLKALAAEQRRASDQQVTTVCGGAAARGDDGASVPVKPDDKGFRTGRAVRGANPAALPDDSPVVIMRDISAIRRLINDDLTQRTAWAVTNRDVYLDGEESFNLMIDKTMEHRKDDADEAEKWLLTPFEKPNSGTKSKKGKDRVERLKPFVPLGQVLPHLIEALKKRGAVAYFNSIKLSIDNVSASKALSWYTADEYTKSKEGMKGIKAAMEATYLYLGARGRIEKPRTVGGQTIVRCTSGWYALMSSFVRQHLEALIYANTRKPRHVDLSCYASWRVELFRVDSFLSTDKDSHEGIVLADGDDPARIYPTGDEDSSYEKLYSDQVTMAAEAAAMEAMAAADAEMAEADPAAANADAAPAGTDAEEADANAGVEPAAPADDATQRT